MILVLRWILELAILGFLGVGVLGHRLPASHGTGASGGDLELITVKHAQEVAPREFYDRLFGSGTYSHRFLAYRLKLSPAQEEVLKGHWDRCRKELKDLEQHQSSLNPEPFKLLCEQIYTNFDLAITGILSAHQLKVYQMLKSAPDLLEC